MVDKSGWNTIKKLKKLEEELSLSEQAVYEHPELVAQVFEVVPDGIIIIDPIGTIRLVNQEAERMFGYTRTELLGQSVEMLIPEEYRMRLSANHFQNPRERVFLDLEGQRKDGTRFQVMIALHPLASIAGALIMATLRRGRNEPIIQ